MTVFLAALVHADVVCAGFEADAAVAVEFAVEELPLLYLIIVPDPPRDALDHIGVAFELPRDDAVFFLELLEINLGIFKTDFLVSFFYYLFDFKRFQHLPDIK